MAEPNAALFASRNLLLGRLNTADRSMLAPHLVEVELTGGTGLFRANEPLEAVFFPDAMTVSIEEDAGDAHAVEIAVIGREGMLGWPALLGSDLSPHAATVCASGGRSLRIAVEPLRRACARSPTLSAVLLQFVHVVLVQMSRTIASQLRHPLGPRLARWLLMRHDRSGGDVLLYQHEEIARFLNVRRASITDQLHLIEGERLVRCNRGRVVIRDRSGLEAYAGDAYGYAEDQYRSLIAPFGKSGVASPPKFGAPNAGSKLSYGVPEAMAT